MTDLDRMNALKSGLSFLLSAISVAVFAAAGLVAWPQTVVMMIAATAGYAGAPLARSLRNPSSGASLRWWDSEWRRSFLASESVRAECLLVIPLQLGELRVQAEHLSTVVL